MIFTLDNIMPTPMAGFQAKAVATSENGWQHGVSEAFNALIDSGARHTGISDFVMNDILENVRDKDGGKLKIAGTTKVRGVYGDIYEEPVYILPHLFLGRIHLTNVAVTVLSNSNIACLIGRSILHQCILTLDPEENAMTFDFKDSLKPNRQLVDGLQPFENVELFVESAKQ